MKYMILAAMSFYACYSQAELLNKSLLIPHHTEITPKSYLGRSAIQVQEPTEERNRGEDKLVLIKNSSFKNGEITVWMASDRRTDASTNARGFVGLAFHINHDASEFEAIYLRPTNARSDQQLRRNHSIQYFSFPDFPWHRLRKEAPSKYEAYADMQPRTWIKYRLQVNDNQAKLYLHNNPEPKLIVNDLKHKGKGGRIGLWIGPGTEAYFSDLIINPLTPQQATD